MSFAISGAAFASAGAPMPGPQTVSGFYLDQNNEPWVFKSEITGAFDRPLEAHNRLKRIYLPLHQKKAYTDSQWLPEKIRTWTKRSLARNQALMLMALNLKTSEVKWIKTAFMSSGPQLTKDGVSWQHLLDGNSNPIVLGMAGFRVNWLSEKDPTLAYLMDLDGLLHHPDPLGPIPPPVSDSVALSGSNPVSASADPQKNMAVISSAGEISGSGRLFEGKLELVNKTNQVLTVYATYEKKVGDVFKWMGPVQYRLKPKQKTLLMDAGGAIMARKASFWAIGEASKDEVAPIWPEYRDKVMDLAPKDGYPGMPRTVSHSFEGKGEK